jgi:hypothetical protein
LNYLCTNIVKGKVMERLGYHDITRQDQNIGVAIVNGIEGPELKMQITAEC